MLHKVITMDNLDGKSFIGLRDGSKIDITARVNPDRDNILQLTNTGLKVTIANSEVQTYDGTFATNVRGHSSLGNQRRLLVKNGIGVVHLDFYISRISGNTRVMELPAGCPTPASLIEVQVVRGNSVGNIWMDENSRIVWCNNLPLNQRIIVDLVGFFR